MTFSRGHKKTIICSKCRKDIIEIEFDKKVHRLDIDIIKTWVCYQNTWHKAEGYQEHKCKEI